MKLGVWWLLAMWAPVVAAAGCTSKEREKVAASALWLVGYPASAVGSDASAPSLGTYVLPEYKAEACVAKWRGAMLARIEIAEGGTPTRVILLNGRSERQLPVDTGRLVAPTVVHNPPPVVRSTGPSPTQKGPVVPRTVVDEHGIPVNVRVTRPNRQRLG
ncbi:MAG TPA: hypothetical protein VKU01_08490 [Bryobacteraceae bacterium]|nr:hypothetical protein [Bryobacteraceae bacterium]